MPAPVTGQVAVTTSALPLSAVGVNSVAYTIKAAATNTNPVFIGSLSVTTGNGFRLDPGDSLDYEKNDQTGQLRLPLSVSDFYVVGTNGDFISWLASP